ncbi:PAS domain S-box protein [bacterium]|nr:PAS domain S-box protein [bacterium]
MLETLSIHDLVQSIEKINGKILIPDKDVNWLWDSINHQYYDIDEHDRTLIKECLDSTNLRSEIREIAGDGQTQFIENIYIPIVREINSSRIILKLSFDISEKMNAEKIISEERNKLASITSNSPDAIIMLNNDMKVISWNLGAESIFEYTADEMIERPIDSLFHPDNPFSRTLNTFAESLHLNDMIRHHMSHCVSKSGVPLYCELTVMFMPTTEMSSRETVLILRDKTHQKQLEDEVKRTIDNISKINEISALIHASLDLNDILDMILVAATAGQGLRFNRAFLFLMNEEKTFLEGRKAIGPSDPQEAGVLWTELDQTPQSLKDILTSYTSVQDGRDFKVNQIVKSLRIPITQVPEQSDSGYLAFQEVITQGHCLHIRPKDDKYLTPTIKNFFETDQMAIVPLISTEGAVGVLVVDNAITGRLISDQDLEMLKLFAHQIVAALENAVLYDKLRKKVEELEEAHTSLKNSQEKLIRSERLAAIGELSANMAHEIRNPLVAIGGFARAMLEHHHYKENEDFLKIIVNETIRLERILNNTLTYVKTSEPTLVSQPLLPIINNALTLLNERLDNNRIQLHTEFADSIPDIEIDPNQILQAILNILINAVEAMPLGGELSLKLQVENGTVCLRVRDTGEGIDEDFLKNIFDPFFTTKNRGTGLGLVIVHDIFERHGIIFRVESEKNIGTSFVINFRIHQDPQPS